MLLKLKNQNRTLAIMFPLVLLLVVANAFHLNADGVDSEITLEKPLRKIQPGAIVPNLKQNNFFDWVASIVNPSGTSGFGTTTPRAQRECPSCKCGTINTVRRIVGGEETEIHQYPWMSILMWFGSFYCGGSLINDYYVLTAAHCVNGFYHRLISVRLLEHNRRNSSLKILDRRVASVKIHENYSSRTIDNDIALIRLNEPLPLGEDLRPVCLPMTDTTFDGETGIVTGWGAVSEGGPVSDTLQEVQVPILSQANCRESNYGESRITDNMLCAGYKEGGKDSCQGDSGGPLHVAMDELTRYQIAGIVSWGEGCAQADSPGVYTRVNRYNEWIKENTRDACYCRESEDHDQVSSTTAQNSNMDTQTPATEENASF